MNTTLVVLLHSGRQLALIVQNAEADTILKRVAASENHSGVTVDGMKYFLRGAEVASAYTASQAEINQMRQPQQTQTHGPHRGYPFGSGLPN